ncbi:MAG: RNA polymerase sigma-70 factor (ECF subfamily) [Planctomycetota bacterium]|jgi:RNA polymerase sigma-70 factor (ECF subfamily)
MLPGSDGQLLQAARAGDAGAFEALVHRHQSALLRHARALVGESGGYEDVVQEAFLRLAQKPPELPAGTNGDADAERAHLLSWLHKVTRNCCMDQMRTTTRRKVREERAATPEATDGGLAEVEGRDTRAAVERSLDKLPDEQQEVVVLRLLGGRSYKEIAEITGKKVGTVGWLISEGLKALSKELAPLAALSSVSPSSLKGDLS